MINLSSVNSIIGKSREVSELRTLIKTVGPSDATVLITGDSGTGKELVAQALHDCSTRATGAFIPVNCGAIPKDLLESELFGHKKGAFTGALSDRKGRFQLANNGTLFLDEIGDMSMDLQVKLLRVLQERIIDPVGSQESLAIDVRVVAATHKNIEALIQQGKFREDLYYRLNVMPLDIARLSERKGDIPALVSHFAKEHCDSNGQAIRLNQFSMQLFNNYSWPGNVRELSNLMARYSALFPGSEVDLRRIPASLIPMGIRSELDDGSSQALQAMSQESHAELAMAELVDIDTNGDEESNDPEDEVKRVISLAQGGEDFPDQGVKLKQHLLNIEKTIIQQALEKANGNVSQAARLLSLQRTTLIEKINKYGLGNSA
ncbi:MAG: sigma-54-dependent Fis family transcriptional regulator [Porticoccaceae bacterium]|mgnify:FL=1|jgi:sigma-54 specific flagellar transcriptional regulator A|nr:sigma-54-dependent Fis family transcriptional regulator [Porticoccaceae bacterium]